MPTSESERREIAARLRAFVPEINGTNDFAMYLNHWIGVGNANVGDSVFSVKSDRRTAEMTLEKLADLIDPTCHIVMVEDCDGDLTEVHDCCGDKHTRDAFTGRVLPYCPDCGARVVSGDGE